MSVDLRSGFRQIRKLCLWLMLLVSQLKSQCCCSVRFYGVCVGWTLCSVIDRLRSRILVLA